MAAASGVGQRPIQSVVSLPLPGMPDPKDPTKRIPRPASESNDCFDVAVEAYENNPLPPEIKQFYLERRARIIASESEVCGAWDAASHEQIGALFKKVTLQDAQSGRFDEDFTRVREGYSKINPNFEKELQSFIKQKKFQNLFDFAMWRRWQPRIEIEERFFKQLRVDPEDFFLQDLLTYFPIKLKIADGQLNELSPLKKLNFLSTWANRFVANQCGLKISSWDPTQPIENLIDEINKHGFLLVGGPFGPTFYPEDALFESKSYMIKGRSTYAFRPGTQMNMTFVSHAIRIVCAQVVPDKPKPKQLVFYQDPSKGSDLSDLDGGRIYCMSYEKLVQGIYDLNGIKQQKLPSVGYAYYGKPVREEEGKKA